MSNDQTPTPETSPVLAPPDVLLRSRSEARRLEQLPRWSVALAGASQDTPLLVRRLDQTDRYYYIVPFRARGEVTCRVRINAHTGKYAEAIAIDKKGDVLDPYLTAEGIRQRDARKRAASGVTKKGPPVVIEPLLGWKPCRQSFSSFLPFYLVWVGKRLQYYRVDGKVYDELTLGAGL